MEDDGVGCYLITETSVNNKGEKTYPPSENL